MRHARLFLTLVVAAACGSCWSQAATRSPLVDAYHAALAFDPAYRAARQEQLAAQEGVALARGALLPEVGLNGAASYNSLEQKIGSASRSPTYNGNSIAVQLRQPIVNPELESREAMAVLRARQADAVLAARQLELGERLVEAYLRLAYARGLAELTRQELDNQGQALQVARRSLAGGEGTTTEVLEAASRADLLRAQLGADEANVENAIETLRAVTGPTGRMPAPRLASRLPVLPVIPVRAGDDGVVAAALATHPEVLARQWSVELARENVKLAQAPYRSRLDWSLSLGRRQSDEVNTVNQVNTLGAVGLQLNVPLYSGGREDAAGRQAYLLVGKAEAELDDTRETVRLRLRQALRNLDSSRERWQALQSAQGSTRQLLAATRRSITGGVRSRTDLLLAERQLFVVLREEQSAVLEHLRAWWRTATARGEAGEPELLRLEQSIDAP